MRWPQFHLILFTSLTSRCSLPHTHPPHSVLEKEWSLAAMEVLNSVTFLRGKVAATIFTRLNKEGMTTSSAFLNVWGMTTYSIYLSGEGEWLLPQRLFMEGGMSASSANPNREGLATSSTSLSGGKWPLPLLIFMEVDGNFLDLLFHRKNGHSLSI